MNKTNDVFKPKKTQSIELKISSSVGKKASADYDPYYSDQATPPTAESNSESPGSSYDHYRTYSASSASTPPLNLTSHLEQKGEKVPNDTEPQSGKPLAQEDVTFGGLDGFDRVDTTRDSWGQYLKFALCHVGILLLLIGYTAAGAFIFVALEHPHERDTAHAKRLQIMAAEREIFQFFKTISGSGRVGNSTRVGPRANQTGVTRLKRSASSSSRTPTGSTKPGPRLRPSSKVDAQPEDWDPQLMSQRMELGSKMREYAALFLHNARLFKVENGSIVTKPFQWTLRKAMFFSATVISTIGYGNIAPETIGGRAFCIVYAIFGIPLLLLVVADLGTLFAQLVHFTWVKFSDTVESNVVSILHMGNNELRKITKKIRVPKHNLKLPIYAALLLLAFYMAAGAGLFLLWEDWTFFNSFYFVFITMTTIGFGDIVPEHTNYLLLMMVYILIGLATMTTCVELVIHTYVDKLKKLRGRVRFVTERTEETLKTETLKKYLQNPDIMSRIKKMSMNRKETKGGTKKVENNKAKKDSDYDSSPESSPQSI